jgi:hypothetical protein
MIPVKSTEQLDAEIDAIVNLRREVALTEDFEKEVRDRIGEAMELANLTEYESTTLQLKVRRFQSPTGGVFYRPNFVMNRKKVMDAKGRLVDLIPFRTMTTLIQFNADSIKSVVSDNNLSEEDTALFVADHAVREEHLRFY